MCKNEFARSVKATKPLVKLIKEQNIALSVESAAHLLKATKEAKAELVCEKKAFYLQECANKEMSSDQSQANLDLLAEKGASSWLNVLPLQEFDFVLNKQEFIDSIRLRYNHPLNNVPKTCACSKQNSIDHALTCKKGGYVSLRHNQVRDLEAHWLSDVCTGTYTEPKLLPLSGERFSYKSANIADDARSDIVTRGFWSTMDRSFFDIRIIHLGAESNKGDWREACKKHEENKKREYGEGILEVEKANFTPLVFTTSGGAGQEANRFHKRLATLISYKRGNSYSEAITHVRQKLRFSLLRAIHAAVRGYRGTEITADDRNSDMNLAPTAIQCI